MNSTRIKSGGEGYHYCDFTAIFDTSRTTEADVSFLRQEVAWTATNVEVAAGLTRNVRLFLRDGKTGVIVHYAQRGGIANMDSVEKDCAAVLGQITAMLEVFENRPRG